MRSTITGGQFSRDIREDFKSRAVTLALERAPGLGERGAVGFRAQF